MNNFAENLHEINCSVELHFQRSFSFAHLSSNFEAIVLFRQFRLISIRTSCLSICIDTISTPFTWELFYKYEPILASFSVYFRLFSNIYHFKVSFFIHVGIILNRLGVDKNVIVTHNHHYFYNGWLKCDHRLMYNKYTTPLPLWDEG